MCVVCDVCRSAEAGRRQRRGRQAEQRVHPHPHRGGLGQVAGCLWAGRGRQGQVRRLPAQGQAAQRARQLHQTGTTPQQLKCYVTHYSTRVPRTYIRHSSTKRVSTPQLSGSRDFSRSII